MIIIIDEILYMKFDKLNSELQNSYLNSLITFKYSFNNHFN